MTTFLGRFRRAVYGPDPEPAARVSAALRDAGRLPPGYLVAEPVPFEHPPPDPICLDPNELPWELQERPTDPREERP